MEKQSEGVDLNLVGGGYGFCGLARGKTDDGSFLIIVSLSSIRDITGFFKFQVEGIDPIVPPGIVDFPGGFVQVDDTDQRVFSFETIQLVVLVYAVKVDCLVQLVRNFVDTMIQNCFKITKVLVYR